MVLGTWLLDESKSGAMPDCYKRTAETSVKGSTLHRRYTGGGTQQKPDIVRKKIVELAGDLPRAELFARNEYPGWVCVGNEIDGMDIRDSLRMLKER